MMFIIFFFGAISDNMTSLVQIYENGLINKTDKKIFRSYVFEWITYEFTLQEDTTIEFQVVKSGELSVWETYLSEILTNKKI